MAAVEQTKNAHTHTQPTMRFKRSTPLSSSQMLVSLFCVPFIHSIRIGENMDSNRNIHTHTHSHRKKEFATDRERMANSFIIPSKR